jgi:hypothetical protein
MRATVEERFEAKYIPEPNSGCHLWTASVTLDGYGQFVAEDGRKVLAHRYAWERENGPIPARMVVRHRCDMPWCVNDQHLVLGSNADNSRDMVLRNRSLRGADVPNAKLTCADVIAIRSATGLLKEIAAQFNISIPTVSDIRRGRRWSWLNQEAA